MDDKLLESLLAAAAAHGSESEPDHELGDLQFVLRACWARLSPKDRRAVYRECGDVLMWLDVPNDSRS